VKSKGGESSVSRTIWLKPGRCDGDGAEVGEDTLAVVCLTSLSGSELGENKLLAGGELGGIENDE